MKAAESKSSNNADKKQLFHRFVVQAQKLPKESKIFPFFEFMDQNIRKTFDQLKKVESKSKVGLETLERFWGELNHQDRVNLYCKWVDHFLKALKLQRNPSMKFENQSVSMQDQMYIKSAKLFSKWEHRIVKLTPTHLLIKSSKHIKQYQLKDYEYRQMRIPGSHKSKDSHNYSWILQSVSNNNTNLYCSVASQTTYNQWFYALIYNIDNARIRYFCKCIQMERENPGSSKQLQIRKQKKQKKIKMKKNKSKKSETNIKTLTQIMIDNQMKNIIEDDDDQYDDFCTQDLSPLKKKQSDRKSNPTSMKELEQIEQQSINKQNPNIFHRLLPDHEPLHNFYKQSSQYPLLYLTNEYKVYELPSKADPSQNIQNTQNTENTTNQVNNISLLKFHTVLPYPKSLIFRYLVCEQQQLKWNQDIDVLTVKQKISTENTALIYEKVKSQGILYRDRDFLYLRHCFSVSNYTYEHAGKQYNDNIFIVDKSIDSIHQPPFMTVVRAEKQIIWGLFQRSKKDDQSLKETQVIIEGFIEGGGYMNLIQNREMTFRFMKKTLSLRDYLKKYYKQYTPILKSDVEDPISREYDGIFKENWKIQLTNEDEEEQQQQQYEEQQVQDFQSIQNSKFQEEQQQDIMYKKQLQQFIHQTNEEDKSYVSKSSDKQSQNKLESHSYVPPPINEETNEVSIPNKYLQIKHHIGPVQKAKKPKYFPHIAGHHLYRGEWQVTAKGGLKYIDEEKMREQKKVLTYIVKRIGKNIFSGKGILNVSLPVDIFCPESNTERLAMSMGFFPDYLEKAATLKQPEQQLKYIVSAGIASSLIYMTIQKPFNPILGQTLQCWLDNCPIYFEQISHHPPIAAFLMEGRGYRVSGNVQAKMELSINSGTGCNQGIFIVQFFENQQNKGKSNKFYFTTPSGCISGITYGERKLNMVGKCYYWSEDGLFLEIIYNPASKSKGFFGSKGEGEQLLSDYIEGYVRQYDPEDIRAIAFKKLDNGQYVPIIPKSSPSKQPLKQYYKVHGRWDTHLICGQQKLFDANQTRFYVLNNEPNPLPSHSNYRQDLVYRRLRNFVKSQEFKQKLQIKQRNDRKLRAKYEKMANQ